MKKYFIIAAASCLLFMSCSKVDPTPGTQANSNAEQVNTNVEKEAETTARPASIVDPQPDKCFTITNTERATGIVEYKFVYTDCGNVVQTQPLEFGQSFSFCSKTGKVNANFNNFVTEGGGNCGPRRGILPPGTCDNYSIRNPYGPDGTRLSYEYYDCDGALQKGVLLPENIVYITAIHGTVNCPGGIISPMR